jgi:hypothetical protein
MPRFLSYTTQEEIHGVVSLCPFVALMYTVVMYELRILWCIRLENPRVLRYIHLQSHFP